MQCGSISINLWLCPQRAIPGLATSYGKGTACITRLASHLYRIFGLGTVKSHDNDISGLQVEGDAIMCTSELITENATKSISSEKYMVGESGALSRSNRFISGTRPRTRGDRGHACPACQGKAWTVTSGEEHASPGMPPREKGQEYSELPADNSKSSIMMTGPEGNIQK